MESWTLLRQIVKKWKASEFDWVDFMIEGQDIGMPVKFLDIETEATPEDHSISMSYILNVRLKFFFNIISLLVHKIKIF